MPSFKELKKNAKKENDGPDYRFAVLGDCATQHLSTAIKGYAYEAGLNFNVLDTDYNLIRASVLDPNSELYQFKPQSLLIYMCSEKLYENFVLTPINERAGFAEKTVKEISTYWTGITNNISTHILQFFFTEEGEGVFGSFGNSLEITFDFQVKKLNYLLSQEALNHKNVTLIDLNKIKGRLGENFKDEKLYYIAKMPISLDALPYVAKEVVDVVLALTGKIKKCVICDLDNTLWGGVIGDDGMEGIEIGELGQGHAYTALQTYLKELKNRGIILGICSKNNEDTAKEPFISHPEMTLRLEDISIFVANWNDKATNIKYIQKVLNIGMDSIVFLDDNPFERNLVKEMIPDITVPDLPEDPALYVSYLKELNLFETASYSSEDINRTSQYQAEVNRQELESHFESYDDYLIGLKMEAVAKPFDNFHVARIAQLTQRSNQFNLRTVRYTEAEIKRIMEDESHLTVYFELKDQFGDHGLISVVILDKQDKETLFISEWLMSCRVLKRGMEEFIVNKIVSLAKEKGYKRVVGEYIPTKKNAMVENIYSNMGFKDIGNGKYETYTDEYVNNKTFIKEI